MPLIGRILSNPELFVERVFHKHLGSGFTAFRRGFIQGTAGIAALGIVVAAAFFGRGDDAHHVVGKNLSQDHQRRMRYFRPRGAG